MTFLYNIGIRIYYFLILLASPFNKKASLWLKGRRNIWKTLETKLNSSNEYAWFHASSLGEFEQGRPIMEALKKEYKNVRIILTFFSPSGYEVRKNYSGADIICYLPLDTRANAKKFMRLVKPKWTFFIKYEYWYHFLKQSKITGSRLLLISGIFRKDQLFFKSYGSWYRKMLLLFDQLFVQTEESGELLKSIGITNYCISGDSRFDRVAQIAIESKDIEIADLFSKNANVIVCGSTWEPDEQHLINYLHNSSLNLKLIIAPHEIHQSHIDKIREKLNLPYELFSNAKKENLTEARILIIDNIGMLSSIYKYGKIAYIGGGFGAGIHNTLEAAVYGVPVIFGPRYQKFREAIDLIETGGGFTYKSYEELSEILNKLLSDSKVLSESGKKAGNYVKQKQGATNIILDYLRK